MKLTQRDLGAIANSRVYRKAQWRLLGGLTVAGGIMVGLAYWHAFALGIGVLIIIAIAGRWMWKLDKEGRRIAEELKAEYESETR